MNQKYTPLLSLFLFVFAIFSLSGCGMRFYSSDEIYTEEFEEKINLAIKKNKYFVFHQAGKEWHIGNPSTENDNGQVIIEGKLEDVGISETEMTRRLKKSNMAYSSRFGISKKASHQIHLYGLNEKMNDHELKAPISTLTKISEYKTAEVATIISHIAMNIIIPSTLLTLIIR